MDAKEVADALVAEMGIDNNCVFETTIEQDAKLIAAVHAMIEDGWEPTTEDIDALASGEPEEVGVLNKFAGYTDLTAILDEIFNG
jgi:hypothetical protein